MDRAEGREPAGRSRGLIAELAVGADVGTS